MTKAEQILQEARNLADVNLPGRVGRQGADGGATQKKAGDYAKIATDLGEKYKLPLYSGRTGLLSAINMQSDKYLRRMYLTTYGYNAGSVDPGSLLRQGIGRRTRRSCCPRRRRRCT